MQAKDQGSGGAKGQSAFAWARFAFTEMISRSMQPCHGEQAGITFSSRLEHASTHLPQQTGLQLLHQEGAPAIVGVVDMLPGQHTLGQSCPDTCNITRSGLLL
jgi:hypothetical protein